MRKYLWFAAPAALLAVVGCNNSASQSIAVKGKVTNVEIFTVAPRNYTEYITLPVVVNPFREANLSLVSGGKVSKIHADKGDRVAEGGVLLETETDMPRASLDLAKAGLEFQKGEFARSTQLFEAGSIPRAAFDAATLALAQARSQYDIAKKHFDDATLEAPFGGVITMRGAEVGDVLGPGMMAFRIIDTDKVRVEAGIPERFIEDFRKGNRVSVVFDALPERQFTGRISYISPEASPAVRTFLSEIVVENPRGLLRVGIMGNARIQRRTFPGALLVPLDALIESQEGRKLFVVKDDTLAVERAISIDGGGEDMIVVTGGVAAGDRIITKGQHSIVNGDRILVTGEYGKSKQEASAK